MTDPIRPAFRPRVLVAEDDAGFRRHLAEILVTNGMTVETVENGQQALTRALRGDIDLVLLDVIMPVMGGLECCRLLKKETRDSFLPVLLVTVRNDTESRIDGLRIGADDYVGKPIEERELIERVSALIRIKKMHDDLTRAKKELESLSIHDDLTGLYNYRYLHTRLDDEFKRADRYAVMLASCMFDVDHFKQINDQYGHHVGDAVLHQIAGRLTESVRDIDVVARYGGEEFLVILPHTSLDGARLATERMRSAVAAAPIEAEGHRLEVTISAGVAAYPSLDIRTKSDLLKASDRALYRAKADGRNCVRVHEEPLPESKTVGE